MEMIVAVIGETLVGACTLWAAMKLTKVQGTFAQMLIVAGASAVLSLIPVAGWLLSVIVMFVLIRKLTDADIWPDAILMVIVAGLISFGAGLLLTGIIQEAGL